MNNARQPLWMFFGGLSIIGFLEFVLSGTGILFVQAYGVGVVAIVCSVFYGALNLVGNRRLHTPIGVTASVARATDRLDYGMEHGSEIRFDALDAMPLTPERAGQAPYPQTRNRRGPPLLPFVSARPRGTSAPR